MPKLATGSGNIYQQSGSALWWIKYYRNGTPHRESSHSPKKQVAIDLLKTRIGEIASGTFRGPKAERVLVEELTRSIFQRYAIVSQSDISDASRSLNREGMGIVSGIVTRPNENPPERACVLTSFAQ